MQLSHEKEVNVRFEVVGFDEGDACMAASASQQEKLSLQMLTAVRKEMKSFEMGCSACFRRCS